MSTRYPEDEFRHSLAPDHPSDAFSGTAEYYARFRPEYPVKLLDTLKLHTGVDGKGNLLDLACGTGEVAIALSRDFDEIWAVDLEPEMIDMAQRKAKEQGIENIRWHVGRAEQLDAPDGHFNMITAGRAFHRLDKDAITKRAMAWLKPGGYLVDLGADSGVMRGKDEEWQRLAYDTFQHWTRSLRDKDGQLPQNPLTPAKPMVTSYEVLRDGGFTELEEYRVWVPFTWTLDGLVGYLHSLSVSSKAALGDLAEGFERDLRGRLLAYSPDGRFAELLRAYYMLGRRPVG